MKIEKNSKQFQNVLAKAIEKKPKVRLGKKDGQYFVDGSTGDRYAVSFRRGGGGAMIGECMCAGAMRGFHCYHLAAALLVHSGFVRSGLRSPAPSRSLTFAPPPAHLSYRGDDSVRNLI